jgi:hypothetical protein
MDRGCGGNIPSAPLLSSALGAHSLAQVSTDEPLQTLGQLFSSLSGGLIGLISTFAFLMGYVEQASYKL